MRAVTVLPYDKEWVSIFEKETAKLKSILGDQVVAVHHFGSTSVPGLAAKPIIDILLVVKDISVMDGYNEALQAIGYMGKGENGIAGRRYFQKGGDNRTHHLHTYQVGSPEIHRHLVFRDYLRSHPSAAREYGELKGQLGQQYPWDI